MSARRMRIRGQELEVDASRAGDTLELRSADGAVREWRTQRVGSAEFVVRDPEDETIIHTLHAIRDAEGWWVHLDGRTWLLEPVVERGGAVAQGTLAAPIPATVIEVHVSNGDEVEPGQILMVLSAMKMQLEIKAPRAGVVRGLEAQAGDSVDAGRALLTVEPAAEPSSD